MQSSHGNYVYSSRSSYQTKPNSHFSTRDSSSDISSHLVTSYGSNPYPTYYTSPLQFTSFEAVWPIAVVEAVAIVIYDIVMISKLRGEELEQLILQKLHTVPSLSMSSREGMLFSGVPVSVVKVLLKQSTAICSDNSLMSINLSQWSLLNPLIKTVSKYQ